MMTSFKYMCPPGTGTDSTLVLMMMFSAISSAVTVKSFVRILFSFTENQPLDFWYGCIIIRN